MNQPLRLFRILDVTTGKQAEHTKFFSNKTEAKNERDRLNTVNGYTPPNFCFIVAPGPDHRNVRR